MREGRSPVSYPREMRARAKADKKGLACLDAIDKHGNRQCYFGPATPAALNIVHKATLALIKSNVKKGRGKHVVPEPTMAAVVTPVTKNDITRCVEAAIHACCILSLSDPRTKALVADIADRVMREMK